MTVRKQPVLRWYCIVVYFVLAEESVRMKRFPPLDSFWADGSVNSKLYNLYEFNILLHYNRSTKSAMVSFDREYNKASPSFDMVESGAR